MVSEKNMTLEQYIITRYGDHRGAQAKFLRDNPHISPPEFSRWKKKGFCVNIETGAIYKETSRRINVRKSLPFKDL
jgi:hypothetical protein